MVNKEIANVVKQALKPKDDSYHKDGDYQFKVNFSIKNNLLIIAENEVQRLKEYPGVEKISDTVTLTKEQAEWLRKRVWDKFIESDLVDSQGIKLASDVVMGLVEKRELHVKA